MGVTHFNALAGVIPCEYPDNLTSPETRRIVLPDAESRTVVSLFVWTKHRNVTDGQTARSYYSAMQTAVKSDP